MWSSYLGDLVSKIGQNWKFSDSPLVARFGITKNPSTRGRLATQNLYFLKISFKSDHY